MRGKYITNLLSSPISLKKDGLMDVNQGIGNTLKGNILLDTTSKDDKCGYNFHFENQATL